MEKKKVLALGMAMTFLVMLLVTISGCNGFQMGETQQDAILKIAARTAGYEIGKKNPELAGKIAPYLEAYLQAETLQEAVIRQGAELLIQQAGDPIIQANIRDLLAMIEVKPPEVGSPVLSQEKLRIALVGFQEGLLLAKASAS